MLARVDGGDELVDHVVGEDHPLLESRPVSSSSAVNARIADPVGGSGPLLEGWMGKKLLGARFSDLLDEPSEGASPDHLDDLVPQLLVHGSVADEGLGVVGAPPVELGAALAPVPPLPLPQDVGDVLVVVEWWSRRSGSCQHTSGFQSMKRSPRATAAWCRAQPAPLAKPGRFRKMQAPSTRRVTHSPSSFLWIGPAGGLGLGVELPLVGLEPLGQPWPTRLRSSLSVKWAP